MVAVNRHYSEDARREAYRGDFTHLNYAYLGLVPRVASEGAFPESPAFPLVKSVPSGLREMVDVISSLHLFCLGSAVRL